MKNHQSDLLCHMLLLLLLHVRSVQWLKVLLFLALRLCSVIRPFRDLSLLKNPCRLFLTKWLGLKVSRGPQRICIEPSAGCDEILGSRSRATVVGVGVWDAYMEVAACGRKAEPVGRTEGRIGAVMKDVNVLGLVSYCQNASRLWRSKIKYLFEKLFEVLGALFTTGRFTIGRNRDATPFWQRTQNIVAHNNVIGFVEPVKSGGRETIIVLLVVKSSKAR